MSEKIQNDPGYQAWLKTPHAQTIETLARELFDGAYQKGYEAAQADTRAAATRAATEAVRAAIEACAVAVGDALKYRESQLAAIGHIDAAPIIAAAVAKAMEQ